MAEYIEKEEAINTMKNAQFEYTSEEAAEFISHINPANVQPVPEGGIGEMSDGYHTFNGLYYQRMVLFAALVNAYQERAWKSWKHEDGNLCFGGGWFIVGIDTPKGSYTYHYEDKYWNWFECEELPVAKQWDGHTEADVTRLLSLPDVQPVRHGRWKPYDLTYGRSIYYCTACEHSAVVPTVLDEPIFNYCPNCGAHMMDGGDSNGR